jgi:ERCC4-type nuclease
MACHHRFAPRSRLFIIALVPSFSLALAFSVLIRESTVSDRLSGMQMHATVNNGVYVILVNDVHGYAEMVKQLSETIAGKGPRRIAKRATLRQSTAQEHRQAVACIPGVKAELASRLVSHFGGFGGVVAASEDDLLKVRACASISEFPHLYMRDFEIAI